MEDTWQCNSSLTQVWYLTKHNVCATCIVKVIYNYAGLFDTQSILLLHKRETSTLCVVCHFAPWAKGLAGCFIRIHIQVGRASHNDTKTAQKNNTGMGEACFPDLPTGSQYGVDIAVGDYYDNMTHRSFIFKETTINFPSANSRKSQWQ